MLVQTGLKGVLSFLDKVNDSTVWLNTVVRLFLTFGNKSACIYVQRQVRFFYYCKEVLSILRGWQNRDEWDGRGMWHVWMKGEACTRFWWGNQDVDGRIILRWIFRKWEGIVETGWSWLRVGTGGGRLWVRWWTLGLHKMPRISWLAAKPVSFSRRTLIHGVSK